MSLDLKWPPAAVLSLLVGACAEHSGSATHVATPCRPEYPMEAVNARAQGVTTVALHIDASGKVTGTEIVKSAGPTPYHRLLDEEAARALSQCPYKPRLDAQGHAVADVIKVDYKWTIEGLR